MEEYRIYLGAEKLYHYSWDRFAAEIIEESKPILMGTDENAKNSRKAALLSLLSTTITLLHPFMPFVTEEIYQSLPTKKADFLMVDSWPLEA